MIPFDGYYDHTNKLKAGLLNDLIEAYTKSAELLQEGKVRQAFQRRGLIQQIEKRIELLDQHFVANPN